MKLVVTHTLLLLAALAVAYQTWAREEPGFDPLEETVEMWASTPEALRSVRYRGPRHDVLLERRRDDRGSFVWATLRTPPPSGAQPSDGGDPPEDVEEVREFLVGEQGIGAFEGLAAPRAVRELGTVHDEDRMRQYGLDDPVGRLVVELDDEARELLAGVTVFGTPHRYVQDASTGAVYVVPTALLNSLEDAATTLPDRRAHAFPASDVARVALRTERGERVMVRAEASGPDPVRWTPEDAPDRPDQTFANFMARLRNLWITDYAPSVGRELLERRMRLEYRDEDGDLLGYLELYRTPEEGEADPEYYVFTEHTRELARISSSVAASLDQDIEQFF